MQPNLMRSIDYWVGVPACFALTILDRAARLVGLSTPPGDEPPENILLIELAEMGTIVVAYPTVRELRRRYPDARIHFLIFEQIRSGLELVDLIDDDKVMTIDSSSLGSLLRDTFRFLREARRRRIDTIINLETFVRFSTILSFLSGARRRVGHHRYNQEGVYTGDLLTHKVSYNAHIHAGHTFLDMVHALAAPQRETPLVKRARDDDDMDIPRIEPDAPTRERLWTLLREMNPEIDASKSLVVVNPNASKLFAMRRLPLEDYASLVAKLLAEDDVFVLIIGVEEERADATFICDHVQSPRALNLAGRTTLRELLELFDMSDVMLTNDSGPAHFACLTGIHVVVMFGPELPDRYRPLTPRSDVVYANFTCSPCVSPFNQRLTPCNNNLCLRSIDLDAVHALVRRRLRERREGADARP